MYIRCKNRSIFAELIYRNITLCFHNQLTRQILRLEFNQLMKLPSIDLKKNYGTHEVLH